MQSHTQPLFYEEVGGPSPSDSLDEDEAEDEDEQKLEDGFLREPLCVQGILHMLLAWLEALL